MESIENTIFIVTFDNGPEASAPSMLPGIEAWFASNGVSNDYENLGGKRSIPAIGPEFASAAAEPSAFFKFYAGEGGLRVPLILSGPGIPSGKKNHNFNLSPTLLRQF
ncbi:MAG: arylsulfatase A-like enzyme [Cryomorphaceae bacterium]|jgi:arylsulfatase A-like enzyme